MGETHENDAEFQQFNKYRNMNVSFSLGVQETKSSKAQARLVRDLDCLSLSDVLVMSSASALSSLSAVLQLNGTALLVNDATVTATNPSPDPTPHRVSAVRQASAADPPNVMFVD